MSREPSTSAIVYQPRHRIHLYLLRLRLSCSPERFRSPVRATRPAHRSGKRAPRTIVFTLLRVEAENQYCRRQKPRSCGLVRLGRTRPVAPDWKDAQDGHTALACFRRDRVWLSTPQCLANADIVVGLISSRCGNLHYLFRFHRRREYPDKTPIRRPRQHASNEMLLPAHPLQTSPSSRACHAARNADATRDKQRGMENDPGGELSFAIRTYAQYIRFFPPYAIRQSWRSSRSRQAEQLQRLIDQIEGQDQTKVQPQDQLARAIVDAPGANQSVWRSSG